MITCHQSEQYSLKPINALRAYITGWIMCRYKLILLIFLFVPISAWASEVSTFSLAQNDKALAYVTEGPYVLWVDVGGRISKIELPELDSVEDVKPSPSISWSGNSKYIAIQYNASEDASYVEVIDAISMSRIWKSPSTSAVWRHGGTELLIVPTYPIDGTQINRGLISFNAERRSVNTIAKEYLFTGNIEAGPSAIVARTVRMKNEFPVYSVIYLDCNSGKEQEIP
jgi:hypothetical protein